MFYIFAAVTKTYIMPQNKNAIERYMILDSLLSNKYHGYTMADLNRICNEKLPAEQQVGIRQTQKDIKFLAEEPPFYMDIERYAITDCEHRAEGLRYRDSSKSIFKKEMSDDEKYLVSEALNILGQLDGIPEMDQLQELKSKLGIENHRKIVDFEKNPMDHTTLFGKLFMSISNLQAVTLLYHTFKDKSTIKNVLVHPYLLKEYHNRWYLICGADDTGKILNFALDRLDDVIPMPSVPYKSQPADFVDRYDEIVGVTYFEENKYEDVFFWVSDSVKDYILTKPIHDMQTLCRGKIEEGLRSQYPQLKGGEFLKIKCRKNMELIREFCSYGNGLVVLTESVRNDMKAIAQGMVENYVITEKKNSIG